MKMIHATARMIFAKALEEKVVKTNPTSSAFIPQKKLTVEEIENDMFNIVLVHRRARKSARPPS